MIINRDAVEWARRPGDPRLDDIHGLKPFMLFAPSFKWLFLPLVAAALAWLAWRLWKRRPLRPAPVAAPILPLQPLAATSALRLLDELANRKLIEADRPRDFHVALSLLMRSYLGARLQLPARRLTTTELLAAIAGGRTVDDRVLRQLSDLLPGCDLAKFAAQRPSRNEMEARLLTARGVIEALGDLAIAREDEEPAVRAGTPA